MTINIGGFAVIIDDNVIERINKYKWQASSRDGYHVSFMAFDKEQSRNIQLHRYIINAPDDKIVDHKNGDTLDNRIENLRLCEIQDNARNRGSSRESKSGYRGVYYDSRPEKHKKPYCAYIHVNGKRISLGCFITAEEASKKYEDTAKEFFGEFYRPVELRKMKRAIRELPHDDGYKYITLNGKTLSISGWCKELGISHSTYYKRLELGWAVEETLCGKYYRSQLYEYNGKKQRLTEWSKEIGIDARELSRRFKNGWDIEKALSTVVNHTRSRKNEII
ncbi:MAG: HNH endonuclease [Treponema sp.]|jgi:hypothetical protein|nr:HNH endonuclease [Treponema sp.]